MLRAHGKWDEFRAHCVAHESTIKGSRDDDHPMLRATEFDNQRAEKRRSRDASGSYVAHPASRFKRLWVVACLGLSLYSLVSAPFGVGFGRRYSRTTCAMDAILFVFFAVDMGLNLAVFAVKRQGKVILERKVFRDLYLRTEFVYDLVSLLPLSLVVALATPDVFSKKAYNPTIHALRFVQALRARRLPAYVDGSAAYLEERWQLNLSGDMTYLILLCASVLLMCHWLACALAYLGRYELWRAKASDQFAFWSLGSRHDRAWRWYADESLGCREYSEEKRKHAANVWVCEAYPPNPSMRIADASQYDRWLVAFYWAVYTCSTVGFGGVSLNSNAEKLLACLGMVLGAVVCDAGIAAVLTAVVEHKDHQHGTNRRRRECGRRMMAAARVPMAARARVAAYFDYVDDDLHNLDDATVLEELNVALRFAILRHAAHAKLCDSLVHGGLEAGVVASMVHDMRPVVAAPGERILEAGQPDPAAYVFAAGRAHAVDDRGHEEYLSVGAILSNHEFRQVAKRVGVPTRRVTFHVERCRGLPPQASLVARAAGASACDPFVEVTVVSKTVFGQSVKTCRTRVRRFSTDPLYDETFALKAYHQTRTALITVYNWARGVEGRRLGQVEVEVQDPKNRRPRWHRLRDARGRRAGDVRLRVAFDPLDEAEISKTAEVTVVADGFCHLYELSFGAQANIKKYIRGLRLTLAKRLETLDDAPAVDWRPAAGALDALAPDALTPARGFEAYAAEAFARRPSPVGLPPARRNSFGDRATTRAPSVSFDHRRSRHSSAQSLRRQSSRLHHAGRVAPAS